MTPEKRTRHVVAELTPDGAPVIQDAAKARGEWIMWFVSTAHPDHSGHAVAWALTADPHGGTRLPGLLVADTLDDLRAMLPAGLTRRDRSAVMARMVTDTWD